MNLLIENIMEKIIMLIETWPLEHEITGEQIFIHTRTNRQTDIDYR